MKQRQSKKIIWNETKGEDTNKSFHCYGSIDGKLIIGISFGDGEFLGTFLNQKLKGLVGLNEIISSNNLKNLKEQFQFILQDSINKGIDTLEFISEEMKD